MKGLYITDKAGEYFEDRDEAIKLRRNYKLLLFLYS